MTGNPRNAMVCDTPYLQNEFGDPPFFYVFNLILSFSTCCQSFEKICAWELLGANVLRYEDWRVALSYFEKDAKMFSFDLKSGYHHIEIPSEHQTFLGFSWKFHQAEGLDRDRKYFVFSVLPFGLSTAPYIFTKCVGKVLAVARGKNSYLFG